MKMLKIAAKGLAGVALAALLAVNVQVGSGNSNSSFSFINSSTYKAEAIYCNPSSKICDLDYFGNIIWGDYHDGKPPSPQKN